MFPIRFLPLFALSLLPGLTACSGEAAAADAAPKHVLLISLDTLRADRTGFGGHSQPTTPFLDSLAARGVVFEDHNSNSNCTLPSHASMLTGLLPPSHGVRISTEVGESLHVLAPDVVTLAERFQEAGYATAAFTAHPVWLNEEYGFGQGFDHFETDWRLADETIESFLEHVDQNQAARSFTFLHFFDIHSDGEGDDAREIYKAGPEWIERFAGPAPEGFTGASADGSVAASEWLGTLGSIGGAPPLSDHVTSYLEGLYDAGLASLDAKLAALFDELEERDLLDETLVVITSDHGEGFGEHGTFLHGGYYAEISHVPLVIVPPARFGVAPHRVESRTQSTDLAPTLLELCRLAPVGETRSLADVVMFGEVPEDSQALFLETVLIGSDDAGDFRLIRRPSLPIFHDKELDPEEVIDFAQDPKYRKKHDKRLRTALGTLDEILDQSRSNFALIESGARSDRTLDASREAELRDLGYL